MENKFFEELSRRMREGGIESSNVEDKRLEVFLHGRPVLFVSPGHDAFLLPSGSQNQKASELYHRVAGMADEVYEYVEAVQNAPRSRQGLKDEFHLLADFGGAVLAGIELPKEWGYQFNTWIWNYDRTALLYLDVSLQWYENDPTVTRSFITGKTLGESGADLDRMYLIASAITKAFHGDRGTYARYLRLGEQPEPEDMILHLNPAEQRTFINALVEQRERQEQAMSQTEQLLRRMTGSITAYMDEVGQRPLRLSDYDKAVLAIRDGEFDVFCSLYPKVPDRADDLLIEAAGRPGRTGGNMIRTLLSAAERFSPEAYLTACKRAVETGDGQRVRTMVDKAESRLSEPYPSLAGEVMLHAYANDRKSIAKDLIDQCTPEQIAAAPPILLRQAADRLDFQTAVTLVDKGIQPGRLRG